MSDSKDKPNNIGCLAIGLLFLIPVIIGFFSSNSDTASAPTASTPTAATDAPTATAPQSSTKLYELKQDGSCVSLDSEPDAVAAGMTTPQGLINSYKKLKSGNEVPQAQNATTFIIKVLLSGDPYYLTYYKGKEPCEDVAKNGWYEKLRSGKCIPLGTSGATVSMFLSPQAMEEEERKRGITTEGESSLGGKIYNEKIITSWGFETFTQYYKGRAMCEPMNEQGEPE